MEKIHTAAGIHKILRCALINPFGAVSGNHFNSLLFFFCKHLAELSEDFIPMIRMAPDDAVPIKVIHDGNILMPFAV